MMSTAVLVGEWCAPCADCTFHEIDVTDLTSECQDCRHTEPVTAHYARQVLEGLEG